MASRSSTCSLPMFIKWTSFIWGCVMMSVSGAQYLFSVYSTTIKNRMGYTTTQIDMIGTFGNFGIYFGGIIPGILFDRFGPRLTSIMGSILMFNGYFWIWYLSKHSDNVHYMFIALLLLLAGIGSVSSYTAALATTVKNAPPKYSGTAAGILVSFLGLCAAIFTGLYNIFWKPDAIKFLLFLAIILGSVALLGAAILHVVKPDRRASLYVIHASPAAEDSALLIKEDEELLPKKEVDYTYTELIQSANFWLLLITFLVITGCGYIVFNNLGTLVESLGGANGDQDKLVIIASVANCLGRALSGVASDAVAKWVNRVWWIVFASVLMGATMLYFAWASIDMLYAGVIAVGLSYGMTLSIAPTVVAEQFGKKHYGGNWALTRVAPGIGSLLFATLLAGELYQLETPKGELVCLGAQCYRTTFLVAAATCLISTILGSILARRCSVKYSALY